MTQIFDEEGRAIPVTVIKAGPCWVTQIKTKEKDGYQAVQLGFGERKKVKKPEAGHLKKVKSEKLKGKGCRYLREVRIKEKETPEQWGIKVGDLITVGVFKAGESVDVSGMAKGKGFTGVVKRHGFAIGPRSHGSDHHREPGSIGSMFPQRVVKGRKLPGRAGGQKVTLKNLTVVKVDEKNHLLCLKGAVPGAANSLVLIKGKDLISPKEK